MSIPLVLCGGVHRSGMALLSLMLDSHPEIVAGPSTNLFCQPGVWSEELHEPLLTWPVTQSRYLGHYFTSVRELEAAKDIDPSPEGLSNFLFRPRMLIERKSLAVDICPENTFAFEAALQTGRVEKVIFCTRDPLESAASQISLRIRPYFGFANWVVQNAIALGLRDRFGPQHVQIIRYEDLVTTPETVASALTQFLGLSDATQAMVQRTAEFRSPDESFLNGHADGRKWRFSPFGNLQMEIGETWSKKLSLRFVHAFQAMQADTLYSKTASADNMVEVYRYHIDEKYMRAPNLVEKDIKSSNDFEVILDSKVCLNNRN